MSDNEMVLVGSLLRDSETPETTARRMRSTILALIRYHGWTADSVAEFLAVYHGHANVSND